MARKLTALDLIKRAIKLHAEEGASENGRYRDVITEILHLAYKDSKLRGDNSKNALYRNSLKDWILDAGFNVFEEEVATAETLRINDIPKKKLSLYLTKEWETNEGEEFFLKRVENS